MATQPTDTGKQQQKTRAAGDELAIIAQRAQAFTNASGVAIALAEGDNTDEIICRARSGSSAPEVGTALRVEGTFTGLCIQSGKELRCDDAETDTRVDMTAIRALGIRSMVVTPIREDSRVIGVLAVFAPTAHAFTITHVAVLKTMSDQISAAVMRERRAREEGTPIEPVRQYAPVAMPKPVASAPVPVAQPVLIKPSASASAAPSPRVVTPAPAKTENLKPVPVAAEIAIPVPFPKREEKPEVRASFGTFDAVGGEEKKSSSSRLIVVAAVVLVVAAVSVFAFLRSRKPSQTSTTQPTQEAANVNSQVPPNAVPVAATAPGSGVGQPAPAASGAVVPAAATRPTTETLSADASRKSERNARPAENPVAPDRIERVASAPTVGVNNAPSRIAASSAPPATADVSPVPLTVSTSSGSGALTVLTAEPNSRSTPSLAQSDVEPLSVLKTVKPVYPAIAKARRMSGAVEVEARIGKDGKATNLKLVSGLPIFRDAAFDAVRQWVFKPAKLNGQPIEQATRIRVEFNPN